jgi:hypothetical protein
MIHGPKDDGTYIIEFRTAEGESLAITIPRTEAAVIKHFQARMPYGLILPDEELPELHIADRKGTRIVSGTSPCASTRSTAEAYRLPWLRLWCSNSIRLRMPRHR